MINVLIKSMHSVTEKVTVLGQHSNVGQISNFSSRPDLKHSNWKNVGPDANS